MNNNKANKAQMATPRKPSNEISASHRRAIALTFDKEMKTAEFAWLMIRSLGLMFAIISLKFALGTGFGIYATYPYRDYSSVTISSSLPIPPGEDASNPETKRNHDLYNYFNQITMSNGIWFVVLAGSGLYLIFGGQIVHRIVTRIPQDRNKQKEIEQVGAGDAEEAV